MTERLSFTLPPSPDEVSEQREQADRDAAAQREVAARARAAWLVVPETFKAPPPELLKRCDRPLQGKLAALALPTMSALLIGPSGCGKSTAAALLLHRALAEYVRSRGAAFEAAADVVWETASELATADRYHPLGQGMPEPLRRAATAGLLVLDDLGLESDPAPIFRVLSERYHQCRPVIATSGLAHRQLTAHLGAAGVRRLTEQHAVHSVLVVSCHAPEKGKR